MLTEQEYIERGGNNCPKCESDDIEGGIVQVDSNTAYQDVSCNECETEWRDFYTLTSHEIL